MKRLLAVLVVVVLAGSCTTNPVTGKAQLDLLGEEQEVQLGKSLYERYIQGSLGPVEDAALQSEVERVGASVASVSHRPRLPYEFTAVNDPEVNAFALPGGKICITRGLLVRLDSEDGLAAVLGHEVGHVTARHVVAAYNRQVLAGVLVAGGAAVMEARDVKYRELITVGAVIGAQLALAHYSREQERQSDELGLQYAVAAGYSPAGMVETQRVLLALQQRQPGVVERLFASHPMSAERLATAEREVAALPVEVRERPVRTTAFTRATAPIVAEQPAWDAAVEGQRLLAEGKSGQAAERFAEAVRLAPARGILRSFHALALEGAGDRQRALSEAGEGVRLTPGVFLPRVVAGELLLPVDAAAALGNLDRAEELIPEVGEVALLRGRALERLGRRQEAVGAYREAVRRDPDGTAGAEAAKRLQALGADSGGGA